MPNITIDNDFSDYLLDKIMNNYLNREPRTGKWHVSDIMFPRYAILSRRYGREPSRDDVGFFFTGEAYHEFIQKILGVQNSEVRGELHSIIGTADYFDGDILLEIKTSRKWTVPELPQEHYIEQAGYYCSMFGKQEARIVVIFPTSGRKWDGSASSTLEIRTWKVTFSQDELSSIESKVEDLNSKLNAAFCGKMSFTDLPPCPDWKYGFVERDSEKKEYFINIRCPFAKEKLCDCGDSIRVECQRKNDNRRIKPTKKEV